MAQRDEVLARLAWLKMYPGLADQIQAIEIIMALEIINPVYRNPKVQGWLASCYELIGALQEKGGSEEMTDSDWIELVPALDEVFDRPPPGVSFEHLIEDLKAAEDKVKRTA